MTASSNMLWIMFLQIRTLSTNLQNGGQQLKFGFFSEVDTETIPATTLVNQNLENFTLKIVIFYKILW